VPLFADHCIYEYTVLAVHESWQNPHIYTTHHPSNSSYHLCYPPSAKDSVCFFVNKSQNPRSYSAAFPTPKYGYLHLSSSVKEAKDIMIYTVYHTGNLSSTSSEMKPPDELLSADTNEIFSHVSAAFSDVSAYHLLLGDFNIRNPSWGGIDARSDHSSQLLLLLQELHDLSLILPLNTVTIKGHNAQSTIDLAFFL
jgi:hypothetical protein